MATSSRAPRASTRISGSPSTVRWPAGRRAAGLPGPSRRTRPSPRPRWRCRPRRRPRSPWSGKPTFPPRRPPSTGPPARPRRSPRPGSPPSFTAASETPHPDPPPQWGNEVKWLVALCMAGAAFPFASLPARAATPGPLLAPRGPERCINLPLSSAELSPSSCWVTGPTSSIIAGTDARDAADGAVYLIHDQKKLRADLPRAGRLTITSVSADQACVRDAAGGDHAVGVNTGISASGCAPIGTTQVPGGVKGVTEPDAAAPTPPPATTSYYVYGAYLAQCGPGATTGCPLYNFGVSTYASTSTPSGLVILDFGAPCYNPNTLVYGTQLFNTFVCTPDDQLVPMAQAWINGFESANPTRTTPTILGLGSSNSVTGADPPTYQLTSGQMFSAGDAWFRKVVKPVATGPTGLAPLTVWAASDIEQSSGGDWSGPATTRPWLDAVQAAVGPATGPKGA